MPSSSIIQTPQQQQQQQLSSAQSIQSPVMLNSYQHQHSSGGGSSAAGGIPHSPMPPTNQHYPPIQSPMPVQATFNKENILFLLAKNSKYYH